MKREPVLPTPRGSRSVKRRLEVFSRANGRCECGCGLKLSPDWQEEHRLPLWLGGADEIENLEAWNKSCHARKTSSEATDRAKVYRLIKKGDPETRKPPKMRSANRWPPKGSQKIQSKPFNTRGKHD